jgi:hypothetical protein
LRAGINPRFVAIPTVVVGASSHARRLS